MPTQNDKDDDGSGHARNTTGTKEQHNPICLDPATFARWERLSAPPALSSLPQKVVDHVKYTLARTHYNLDTFAGYQAAAYSYSPQKIFNRVG